MSSTNQPLKSSREGSRASGCDRHRRRATPRSRRTRRPAPTPRPPRRTTPYGTPPCRARGGALFLMSEVSMYASPAHSRRTTPCGPLPAPYTPHPPPSTLLPKTWRGIFSFIRNCTPNRTLNSLLNSAEFSACRWDLVSSPNLVSCSKPQTPQGYLTYKKTHPPRTLP